MFAFVVRIIRSIVDRFHRKPIQLDSMADVPSVNQEFWDYLESLDDSELNPSDDGELRAHLYTDGYYDQSYVNGESAIDDAIEKLSSDRYEQARHNHEYYVAMLKKDNFVSVGVNACGEEIVVSYGRFDWQLSVLPVEEGAPIGAGPCGLIRN